jgi:hypothetical protein
MLPPRDDNSKNVDSFIRIAVMCWIRRVAFTWTCLIVTGPIAPCSRPADFYSSLGLITGFISIIDVAVIITVNIVVDECLPCSLVD